MIIEVYRVREDIPDFMKEETLRCERTWDLTPGIYRKIYNETNNYRTNTEVFEALENNEIEFDFEIADLVKILPDMKVLNEGHEADCLKDEKDCDCFVFTQLGWEELSVDRDVFVNMSIEMIAEYFDIT